MWRHLMSGALLFLVSAFNGALADDKVPELPTKWEIPPGDKFESAAAAYAKAVCSHVFISGRDPEKAKGEDGYFLASPGDRRKLGDVIVKRDTHSVDVRMPNGIVRTAKLTGSQGCVTLPRGEREVFFKPQTISSALPDPDTQDWPMGDRIADNTVPPQIDRPLLDKAVEAAFGEPKSTLTAAFVVAYKGKLIAERYGEGVDYKTPLAGWSMGKSVNATIMARLIQEGAYDLWSPVPVEGWEKPDDPRHAIRIADLLRMSSGLRCVSPFDPDYDWSKGYADHYYIYSGAIDAFRWAITRPPQYLPNTVDLYRNCDPLVLGYLIRKAVEARGEDYLSYPQRDLFDKIGVRRMVIETDPFGNFLLPGYEFPPARDWVRLGLLYWQGGVWNGERLLPQGWTDFVRTPAPAQGPNRGKYGAAFWLWPEAPSAIPEGSYFMEGFGGQYTIILPSHDLVVVRIGHDKGESWVIAGLDAPWTSC
jgi:CubicO group peptidase (beta-lactamase class C family)